MIGYEVTVEVREDLRGRFEVYMRERHIPDVLATGLFLAASFERADAGHFRTRYELADRATYDRYLAIHAARLRTDFGAHFPEGVEASREVWTPLRRWPH